ncbi:MAG: ABC transporter permease [Myxococcota bacterium]|nr:FtsX-like permease family protein [Myxococcota bacterium]
MLSRVRLLVGLAWRSVLAHRGKSLTLSLSFMLNTALLIVIGSVVRSSSQALEHSLTESFVGHLQVYSNGARDTLDMLVTAWTAEQRDSGNLKDYEAVAKVLEQAPEVRGFAPIGIWNANIRINSPLQEKVQALRRLYEREPRGDAAAVIADIRQAAGVMLNHVKAGYGSLARDAAENAGAVQALERAVSDTFWTELEQDPAKGIEFLDTKIVRWAGDTRILRSPVLGVDFEALQKASGRFELVSGKLIPPGVRGILLEHDRREAQARHPVLLALDDLAELLASRGRLSDADMSQRRARLVEMYDLIGLQLPADKVAALRERIRAFDPTLDGELGAQLRGLLAVDNDNFAKRRAFIYEAIAPLLRKYSVDVGDIVSVNSRGRDGAPKSVRATVFGTYRFRGVQMAKHVSYNLVDFATFREIYGEPTAETLAEMAGMRERYGIGAAEGMSKSDEAALFGGAFVVEEELHAGAGGFTALVDSALDEGKSFRKDAAKKAGAATTGDLVPAVVVWLADEHGVEAARARLSAALQSAGVSARVSTWREAASRFATQLSFLQVQIGMGGIAVFLVTLIVANLGVVIATAGREGEIGTLRAQGASRGFVLRLLMCESLILSFLSALVGAAAGVALLAWVGRYGIPAQSPAMEVIFGGPRLFPVLGVAELIGAISATVVGSLIATALPAFEAASTEPQVAMRQRW